MSIAALDVDVVKDISRTASTRRILSLLTSELLRILTALVERPFRSFGVACFDHESPADNWPAEHDYWEFKGRFP